jgi:N6-L-threonylcarbamoyladenine synthase
MIVLGIETSCDETSASVLRHGVVESNIISSQLIHRRYGGIVPELASRAHQRLIVPVVEEALQSAGVRKEDLDAVAVTRGPGLMGALLVGVNFAKALSFGLGIPLTGVNHMEGHIYSTFLSTPRPQFPFLCLIVSGGHTQLLAVDKPLSHRLLGETLDDAAGEAYDKVGKMLGLGFPGGPVIDSLAKEGNPAFIQFPRSLIGENNFDFSFSGIKTAVLYWLKEKGYYTTGPAGTIPHDLLRDICASFQAAVADVLTLKTMAAARQFGLKEISVAGGVSANSELRRRLTRFAADAGKNVYFPAFEYCTDNAAMIAMVGDLRLKHGHFADLHLSAVANLPIS